MDARLLARAYDREAARYDARFLDQQRPKFEAVARLVPPPDDGAFVLDLGGGTGLLAGELARVDPRWSRARFVVADLSPGMLAVARARGLRCVVADARRLPFRRAAFARVVSVTGLVESSHVERAVVAAARVLAPGGLFALTLREPTVPADLPAVLAHVRLGLKYESAAAGDRIFILEREIQPF